MEFNEREIQIIDAIVKVMKNKISTIFTEFICNNTYSDDRPKKRRYLTDIEFKIHSDIDSEIETLKKLNNSIK